MPLQEWSEQIWLVQLSDDPAFSDELGPVIETLQGRATTPGLVVDLSDVRQINSSNLSQLLRLRKLMVEQDATLRLADPADAVWSVFIMTGLDKVFQFSENTATAIAELQLAE